MDQQQDYNPDTHVRGEDGVVREIQRVTATGTAAGLHVDGQAKTALAEAMEKAMAKAVADAQAEGVTDGDQLRERILAARDQTIASPPQAPEQTPVDPNQQQSQNK